MRIGVRINKIAGLAIGIAISMQVISAQKQPTLGGIMGGPHLPPNMNGQTPGPPTSSINGSIYLSGNVMLDDGTPPPDPVTIERVCSGAPRAQGYTDQKGRFSFQIGQTAGVMQDASEEGSNIPGASRSGAGLGTVVGATQPPQSSNSVGQLANCDLRAVLAGFRSDTVSLGGRQLLDDPNVGTIVLHRLANVEGTAISVTSLQAPKEARRAYERAVQHLRKEKTAEAEAELRKAVEIYPHYAAAWYELGRIQAQEGDTAQARNSFAASVAADGKYISPYLKLAELDAQGEDWAALADTTSRVLKLDPVDYPMAYFYNATANLKLGRLDDAESSARAGQKLDTAHQVPRLEQILAKVLAAKKDYAGAAAHLSSYLALAPDTADAAELKKQLAELERLSGANEQAKASAAQE